MRIQDTGNMEVPESDLNRGGERSLENVCATVPVNRQRKKARKSKKNANESLSPTKGRKQDGMATETKRSRLLSLKTRN